MPGEGALWALGDFSFVIAPSGRVGSESAHWALGVYGRLDFGLRGIWHHRAIFKPTGVGTSSRLCGHGKHTVTSRSGAMERCCWCSTCSRSKDSGPPKDPGPPKIDTPPWRRSNRLHSLCKLAGQRPASYLLLQVFSAHPPLPACRRE